MSMFASGEEWEQQIYLNETWQASHVRLHMPPYAETQYIFQRASLQLSLAEQHAEYIGPSLVLDMPLCLPHSINTGASFHRNSMFSL